MVIFPHLDLKGPVRCSDAPKVVSATRRICTFLKNIEQHLYCFPNLTALNGYRARCCGKMLFFTRCDIQHRAATIHWAIVKRNILLVIDNSRPRKELPKRLAQDQR
jgi:hypothetical protein